MLRRLLYILLVLSIAVPVQAASPYGRFHALVIGNQNYEYLKSLKTPRADAEAVAEVLKKQYGFEVDLVLDGNRKEIMRAFSKLRKTMTSEKDNLLIYYAGHGYLDRLSGVGYWQPVDAEQDNDIDWIPTSRVTNLLKVLQTKHVLVVADSCYSGNLVMRESEAQLASGMERNAWLQRMLERRSRNALTSGGEEPVLDSGGGGHSVFAKAFLEVLRGNREVLDGDSLFDQIKSPVIANARQTPLYGVIKMTNHDWGDFLLVPTESQGIALTSSRKEKSVPDSVRGMSGQKGELQRGDTMIDPTTGMEFVYIPKGCFKMGSPPDEKGRNDDEGPVHEVCVDGFWMGKYEVTQGQWKMIMGKNPATFQKGDNYPVEQISWEDAQKFILELNRKSGKQYRLPTEAEWEYAACAEIDTARFWGASDDTCRYANVYDQVSRKKYYDDENNSIWNYHNCNDGYAETAPVGSFWPNISGLYDMNGNVWEWCADWYGGKYYTTSPRSNPTGPVSGTRRVLRGGAWSDDSQAIRCSARGKCDPTLRHEDGKVGFRVVISLVGF
ncbi:MAG: SUMF1/EgtB/PvdO family nonheme iron enzyme [Candidatus Electrothrix aestuarii]|uniref:SUMF1/EgtB/PvdO family nonheme iron enzyme n=1 Tax=Candidatus Electrothrix aestuarii TaxID=3062594 RepID=A0AAU8LSP1_9BACT|nr:SUMF1/EgtB/PvdO family nonheme iron enzyme [Candidatus Electrothrix aestuarii]